MKTAKHEVMCVFSTYMCNCTINTSNRNGKTDIHVAEEPESETVYLTIIHVQFIMEVINLLNILVKDDLCKGLSKSEKTNVVIRKGSFENGHVLYII